MNNNIVIKKSITCIATILILIVALLSPQFAFALTDADQEKVDELKDQIASIEEQIKASQNKIDAIAEKRGQSKDTLSDLMDEVQSLDKQINSYNKKISLLNRRIVELDFQIKKTKEDMNVQQGKIENTKELLSERIRAMYIAGETSSIEILMSADSFESFLTRIELVQSVTRHDSKLINDLEEQMNQLKKMEKELREQQVLVQSDKDEVSKAKAEILPKKAELNTKVLSMNRQISYLNAQDAETKRVQQKLEAQREAFEREVDDILNGLVENGSGSVGNMIWPLPYSGTYITSPYGYRTMNGVRKFHYGIDISMPGAGGTTGPFTKRLVAVADGKVVIASNDGSWNGGYGNYLAIDHGNGVVTVYGHCYKLNVSYGQMVTQGQTVAIMGSTGNSTGAHVHFEVRVNGSKMNPQNYLSMPSDVYIRR